MGEVGKRSSLCETAHVREGNDPSRRAGARKRGMAIGLTDPEVATLVVSSFADGDETVNLLLGLFFREFSDISVNQCVKRSKPIITIYLLDTLW